MSVDDLWVTIGSKKLFLILQREQLVKAFDGGLNSVSKASLPLIQQLATKLHKDEKEIKASV